MRNFNTKIAPQMLEIEVAIIGGGLSGFGAALELAKNNIDCALFEAYEIGAGASGRNGGLVCSGFRHDQKWLEAKMGKPAAQKLWQISQNAKASLEKLLKEENIDADYAKGLAFAAHSPKMMEWLIEDKAHLENQYDYKDLQILDKSKTAKAIGTDIYYGSIKDNGAGRIHPLKLLYGMANAAINKGAQIFENCPILEIDNQGQSIILQHKNGQIKAKKLIICGDGYLTGLMPKIEAKVLPIYSFVIATEPLKEDILSDAVGAMDTKFVVNYFQKTYDNRLLFGGGEKYTPQWPQDVAGFVKKNLLKIYPQLENTKIEYAWGGALGITSTRLPYVAQIAPNIYSSSGYSGQGVLLAPYFGKILAQEILQKNQEFAILNKMPVPDFPGGRALRFPLLTAAMSYYSILDKLP